MPAKSSAIGFRQTLLKCLCLACAASLQAAAFAQANSGEPTNPKATKTFAEAVEWEHRGSLEAALDSYRKANKQDGGHCSTCLDRAYKLALEIGDYKAAEAVVTDQMLIAGADADRADLHFRLALALQRQGVKEKKDTYFTDSLDEFKTALALDPHYARVHYSMGISLAWLHRDEDARNEFISFLRQNRDDPSLNERAQRYADRIELARSRMAPPFSATTIDGQRISLDGFAGKVVLIDFWATWCPPCVAALPHIQEIARRFEGQPLVVISVSFDNDDAKWRAFVAKNHMTWVQIRDGRFTGPLGHVFDIRAIPATLSIDADGVLEDQHEGDAAIDGKLKKLVEGAAELANRKPAPVAASAAATNGNVE